MKQIINIKMKFQNCRFEEKIIHVIIFWKHLIYISFRMDLVPLYFSIENCQLVLIYIRMCCKNLSEICQNFSPVLSFVFLQCTD